MKSIHIVAGLLAITFGAIALYAAKGSPLHRKAGALFVIAMLVMTSSAAISAIFLRPNRGNAIVALLTCYLVCTAWLAIKRPVQETRAVLASFALAMLGVGAYALSLALSAIGQAKFQIDGLPAQVHLVFGSIAIVCGASDVRLLWVGQIAGTQRLVRHLWRMCFAMFIATASFFLGQAKFFPLPVRKADFLGLPILAIPVLLVLGSMLYWLGRTLLKRKPSTARPSAPAILK
jgi:uncharacterized membrane protein